MTRADYTPMGKPCIDMDQNANRRWPKRLEGR